ncbi:Beta-myrcene/(E)-beta-ocimene synthase 2 [Citrus sinensis]|nr:Beta-myrcene/(E)-beta-ocimene synthase 2 [Citrus sinensis]
MVTDLLYFNHPSFLAYKPRRFLKQRNLHRHGAAMAFKVCCSVNPQTSQLTANRRSANYQPPLWEYVLLQSFKTHQVVNDKYQRRAKELEEEVKFMINNENGEMLPILELIDDVQRLGLGYRFENEIKRALHRILSWQGYDHVNPEKDLHVTALRFRLLRQHGFDISQGNNLQYCFEVQRSLRHSWTLKPEGNFTETVHKDVKGVLSLNEASYLAFEGEDILNEALTFSRTHLNQLKTKLNPYMSELVSHSLELPRHYRMRRLEVRWWWEDIDLAKNLKFARDRLMECFIWSVGMVPKPQYSNCRRALTKVAAFVTIIDYIYAVYGTLDELELFTYAVERWDINAVNDLPNYMKLSFLALYNTINEMAYDILKQHISFPALYNTVNEMAYDILKQHGEIIIPYLTKAWADLCKSFLQEAKWSYNEYTPTFEEYLENAWRSSSGELSLVHSYFLVSRSINKKALESLGKYHNLIRWPSTIFRLSNDLATSKHPFVEPFVETAFNLARIAQCTYQYGDEHGAPDGRAKKRVVISC